MKSLCNTKSAEIHIIFTKTVLDGLPIINYEAKKNSDLYDNNLVLKISGPTQERTLPWSKCVRSHIFRNELIEFCMEYWKANEAIVSDILKDKRVFLVHGQQCFLFSKAHEMKKNVISLRNNHSIFELKVILHVYKTCENCTILIKSQNPDFMLILMLHHMQFMEEDKQIFILSNTSKQNKPDLINVSQMFKEMDSALIKAMPAWFVFTGCPYEPVFFGKTRRKAYQVLVKNPSMWDTFAKLGSPGNLAGDATSSLEEYCCKMYSSGAKTVNVCRKAIFQRAFNGKNGKH